MIFDEPRAEVSRAQNTQRVNSLWHFQLWVFSARSEMAGNQEPEAGRALTLTLRLRTVSRTKSETFRSRARSVMSGRFFLESAVGPRISRAGALLKRQCVYSPTLH